MSHWRKCSILILAAVFISGCAEFHAVFDSPGIKSRRALMKKIGKSMKDIKGAAKAGDANALAKAAGALYKSAGKVKKAFSKKDMAGSTRSLPAIWKNKADFNMKADNLAASAAVLAQIWAKSGNQAQIDASIQRIGKTCGACHKAYRAKKKM